MNKPKLLITLGCSYTEGVGCWDETTTPSTMNINTVWNKEYKQIYLDNLKNFREKGWPNKLGRKLGYDKVINLGLAGSSTSGQLKVFLEKYGDVDFSEYDVLVVWLLTEPSRFSFYRHGGVKNIMPTVVNEEDKNIGPTYLDFIHDIEFDPLLEQIHHIKCLINICENKGYGLVMSYWEERTGDNLVKQFKSPYFLYGKPHRLLTPYPYKDPYVSPVCHHPNENGYEMLAENFYKGIKKYHPQYLNNNKSETFEWVWDGEIVHHKKLI